MKMSSYELGLKSLRILLEKVRLPDRCASEDCQKSDAKRIKCSHQEINDFWWLFHALQAGKANTVISCDTVTERQAWIAYRILKMHYFWDFRGINEHITFLAQVTKIPRNEVSAIVEYIMRTHLRDTFANPRTGKLHLLEINDNRHSELPNEKPK